MKIEIKKISLPNAFDGWSYPEPGFYHVNDSLMIVDKSRMVWTVGSISNYDFLKESEQPSRTAILESTPSVSESFALRMLAVAMNNHESLAKL